MHLSRCARFIARFVSVIYLAFVVYTLFRFPSMDGMMVVIGGLGVFWMAFYTEEQLKERRLSVWLSAAFVILLTLILIYSDFLYSVLNIALSPITAFVRFLLVVLAGLLTIFVSMISNDLYPNFTYWITRQGTKPINKPLRLWIVFFVLTLGAAVCSAIAAIAPSK